MTNPSEKRYDSKIGDEYEIFNLASPYYNEIQNGVLKILKDNLPNEKEINVVEVGFGTGITSELIIKTDNRIKLFAVDNVEKMLLKANNLLQFFDSDRYQLNIEDALDYLKGFSDNSILIVISVFVLHNLEKTHRYKAIKEIFRILKPGGIFITGDKIANSNPAEHQKNFEWQLKKFDIFETIGKPELKNAWIQHYKEDEMPDKILIEDQFKIDLEKIGFSEYNLINRKFMDVVAFARKSSEQNKELCTHRFSVDFS
jgi:ubiquinone/menaquinone biosynthesis C-methylase UbiE